MKHYSIAEARNHFTSLVHAAEEGQPVAVTRRGRPIAVLLSLREYERLSQKQRGFAELYRDFLRRNPDLAEQAIETEDWLHGIRDSVPGRDFSW
jgi:prevent-host-death family protein